jgi:hypothetical protein
LILQSAPDLLLFWPGAVLAMIGVVCTLLGFAAPAGVGIGSLRWQPVFFSTICLVVGVQGMLAGAVSAYRSSIVSTGVHRRFAFVGHPSFGRRCMQAGAVALLGGLAIDVVLFVVWIGDNPALSRGLAMASLAQTLIIIGAVTATNGFVARALARADRARDRAHHRATASS